MQPIINTMLDPVVNFGKVTVSTGYTIDTVIVLTAGHGSKLPDPSIDGEFNLVWYDSSTYADPSDDPNVEIVRCTVNSVDILTVDRGQESTSISNKNTPTSTYKMILSQTRKTISDIKTEYESGISSGISTHSALDTGVHGVGIDTVDSVGARNSAISTHAAITSSVHGFDSSGNAPAQVHGVSKHTGTIGDHANLTSIGTNMHTQIDTAITNSTSHIANSGIHIPSQTGNTGKYLKTDGSIASWQSFQGDVGALSSQIPKMASTNVRNSNDAVVYQQSLSFVLLKTITLTNGLSGSIRVYFEVDRQAGSYNAIIRIAHNGTSMVDITIPGGGGYNSYSYDITQTFLPGDTIQLWAQQIYSDYYALALRNFRLAYDNDPTVASTSSNP